MKAKINNNNKARFIALYVPYRKLCFDTINNEEIDIENITLNLKPLSQISDEDAMEIGYQQCDDELNFNYGMSPSGCFLDEIGDMDEFLSSDADYFRSRGYALPWMGLTVEEQIEAGWIKLMEV